MMKPLLTLLALLLGPSLSLSAGELLLPPKVTHCIVGANVVTASLNNKIRKISNVSQAKFVTSSSLPDKHKFYLLGLLNVIDSNDIKTISAFDFSYKFYTDCMRNFD
jgi:hypothetical protein